MYRIDNQTAVAVIPTPAAVGPNPQGFFSDGDPATLTAATIVDDDWLNSIQEELCAVLAAASIAPSKTTRNQLLTAILALIGAGTGAFVPLSHMGIHGTAFNSGGPNISASASFTPGFDGILLMNGTCAQQAGEFTGATSSATGTTSFSAYGNTSAGAASNLGTSGFTSVVTAGTPVTITFAMTGTGANNSATNIGFNYFVIPTS